MAVILAMFHFLWGVLVFVFLGGVGLGFCCCCYFVWLVGFYNGPESQMLSRHELELSTTARIVTQGGLSNTQMPISYRISHS